MNDFDTPLGRLFEFLSRYEEVSRSKTSIRLAWSAVLNVPEDRVALELAILTADLLPAVEEQVSMSRNAFVGRAWNAHGREWCAPFLHEKVSLDSSIDEVPARNLDYLGLVYTGEVAAGISEGPLPSEDQIDEWIDLLDGLCEQVEDDKSLDGAFREDLVLRINGLIAAMKRYDQRGPAGVQAAVREVLGELVLHQAQAPKGKRYPTITKVVGVLMTISAGVATYPDFRAGAIAIGSDASHVIETVAGEWREQQPGQLPAAEADKPESPEEQDEPPAA